VLIENALCKDLKVDIGLDYFNTCGERLKRLLMYGDNRIPSYYPQFDEYINGGFPAYTLSVMLSRIHGGKCLEGNTAITIRNNEINITECIPIREFFERFTSVHKYKKTEVNDMIGLDAMKLKYGDDDGTKKYNEWKKNVGKASKNRNTLQMFQKKYGDDEGIKKHDLYILRQKQSSKRAKEYWLKRGYTEDESIKMVKECQTTFSKEKCIEKYGKENGLKRWAARQDKWQNTMKSKPIEEIERINKKKGHTLINYQQKYGDDDGIKKWIQRSKDISRQQRRIDIDLIDNYIDYKAEVNRISNINIELYGLENSSLRGREQGYSLDHKVSMCYGFNNNINPSIMGSIYNLEMLEQSENCRKQDNNSISPDTLFKMCDNGDLIC